MLCATQRSLACARPGQAGLHLARRAVRTMSTAPACTWRSLGAGPQELNLDLTMPTGQSFRWRKTAGNAYTGVIGTRVVQLRQLTGDVEFRVVARGADASPGGDAAVLADYCNLRFNLSELTKDWAARDARFREVSPYFPGARMLRQDPMECLFQFICSSNNHISRIHGMVERLCSTYGTPLTTDCAISPAPPARILGSQQQQQQQGEELASPSRTAAGGALAAGPSASPFAAAASGAPAAATPVPVKVRRAGEPATPRLASALAHVADEVAEARAAADEQAVATPAAKMPVGGAAGAAGAGTSGAGGTPEGADAAGTADGAAGGTAADARTVAAGAGAGAGMDAAGGTAEFVDAGAAARPDMGVDTAAGAGAGEREEEDAVGAGLSFYAFPTLEQLEATTEEDLRAAGFGLWMHMLVALFGPSAAEQNSRSSSHTAGSSHSNFWSSRHHILQTMAAGSSSGQRLESVCRWWQRTEGAA